MMSQVRIHVVPEFCFEFFLWNTISEASHSSFPDSTSWVTLFGRNRLPVLDFQIIFEWLFKITIQAKDSISLHFFSVPPSIQTQYSASEYFFFIFFTLLYAQVYVSVLDIGWSETQDFVDTHSKTKTSSGNIFVKPCLTASIFTGFFEAIITFLFIEIQIKEYFENKTSDNNEFQQAVVSKFLGNDGIDIEYSLQETSDENFIAETYLINEELGQIVMTYYLLENQYKESKIKRFVSKSNEQEIKLLFIDNNEVEITITTFDHSETFDLEYKNGLLINNNLPENLKDKYYILDGENLKVYINKKEGYELYKKK